MESRPPAVRLRLLLPALLPLAGLSASTGECDTRADCDAFNTGSTAYTCVDSRCVVESTADGGAGAGTDAGTAAGGGTGGGTDAGTGPTDGGVSFRGLHAVPDAPAVDVYAQGIAKPLATGVSYRATSAYVTVPAGMVAGGTLAPAAGLTNVASGTASAAEGVAVSATPSGWGVAPAGTPTPAATANFTPAAGGRSFLVAAGLVSPGTGEPGLQLWTVDVGATPWTTAVIPPMPQLSAGTGGPLPSPGTGRGSGPCGSPSPSPPAQACPPPALGRRPSPPPAPGPPPSPRSG